ncbi:hypothetical protein [Aggregatilinea lenta]|uniref:hypothetical protein n=1 Tax=Aggregatilinea lenta TaxID=913108 RepID=UPI000E5AA432|nr:hypothetical protein [Aggregatilinea lenta]
MIAYRLGQAARVWVTLVVLIAALLASGATVRAQGGTEEPDPATETPPDGALTPAPTVAPETHIFGYSAPLRFPLLIGFVVNIDVPVEDIVAAALTVAQPNGYEQRVVMDTPADYMSDGDAGYTNLRYDWLLLEEPALFPFETVEYTWQIETADGLLSSLTDSLVLVDAAAGTWRTTGTPPVVLHTYKTTLAANRVQREVLAAYDMLLRRTGAAPMFEFVIYEPTADYCQQVRDEATGELTSVIIADNMVSYPCDQSDYEQIYRRAGMTPFERTNASLTDLEDTMVAAMVRQVYGELWGDAAVPAWFANGLTGFYGLRPNLAALAQARAAIEQGTLLDYAALGVEPGVDADPQVRQTWKAESYLLTLYLADQYGADAPFELADAVADSEGGFGAALEDVAGTDLQGLWEPFVEWLSTAAADSAASWTPYVPVTPTPTVSPTVTPITPTLTATVTPSPTITLTPTPPNAPQPTAVVAVPTATPVASATNTPLPPGSLPTVAPTTAAPVSAEDGDTSPDPVTIGIIAVVAAFGLLIVWLGVVSLRRRLR